MSSQKMISEVQVKECGKEFIVDGWKLKCQLPKGHDGPHCRNVVIPRTSSLGPALQRWCESEDEI